MMLNGVAITLVLLPILRGAAGGNKSRRKLKWLAGGTNKFAQHGDVGTVHTDTTGIHGKTETFGKIKIDAGIIQFRQAITLRGRNAIQARRIHRPGRTMTAPRAARQFVELLPIAFLPSGHGDKSLRAVVDRVYPLRGLIALFVLTARSQHWMPSFLKRFPEAS